MASKNRIHFALVAFTSAVAALLSLNPSTAVGEAARSDNATPALAPRISEADAISSALNDLTQSGSEVRLHNPRHDVVFGEGGVLFTPWRAQEDWHWSLGGVRKGEALVEVDASTAPVRNSNLVRYERGAITEQYVIKSKSVEQQFVLHAPIAVEGDLVVSGNVVSSGEFSASDSAWNWGDVKLGDVTVYDAAGAQLSASMTVTATGTTIRVSGTELATATYPVLIDPEVGTNDFRISDMNGNGATSRSALEPEIAYNATDNEYLVVWHGQDVNINDEDIYGQRINASTGAEVGTNDFQISSMGSPSTADDALDADVAWNSTNNEYLVVWEGRLGGDTEIFGQFVSNTGTLLGSRVQISDMGTSAADPTLYQGLEPSVAYNSTDNNFLVTWRGDDNIGGLVDGEVEVFGQLMDGATRTETGSDDFQISAMFGANGDASRDVLDDTHVTYNATNNEYFVVWTADNVVDGEFEVYGQRITGSTGVTLNARIQLSDVGTTGSTATRAQDPNVAWNSSTNEYLVVWEGEDTGTDDEWEIWGQRVNAATGGEVGTNDFRISTLGPAGDSGFGAFDPKVAYNSVANEWFVVWWGDDTVNNDLEAWGQRISATGSLTGSVEQLSQIGAGATSPEDFDARDPAVASSTASGQMLVAWYGDDNVAPLVDEDTEIFGQRWALPDNPPSITANAAGVAVTQGQTTTGATIATVSDVEDANGSLTVTATSVPTGISITNITNTSGTITADVSATAAAAPGANSVTLQVEDSATNTTTDTLTVNVTDDTNPTITAGSAVNVTEGQTVTGVTIASVTDAEDANGTLTVTATSVPTGISVTNITNTGGTITADISATTAATLGANSVTLQVEDSLSQTDTDTLTVNVLDDADPSITAAGTISVAQGGASNGVTIATVSDTEDANGTLTVTATSLPTGITVTNITNTGGTITADVAASGGAALGNNSVTLQVEDSLTQTSTDTLTVNVVVNTTPVITAATGISIQQGDTATGATIATVSDAEDAAGTLVVTATIVPAGITVTNITNTGGTVTADITVTGAAATGANAITLQVVDSLSTANTDTLSVNVTSSSSGGGGGDDDDEDCSTGSGSGYWFLLLIGVLSAVCVRRTRSA